MTDTKQLVFISCGQATAEEKTLGKQIAQLVEELTLFKPYFADFQTSLQGVTQNIFAKLNIASGFIAVMHHRGEVSETKNKSFPRASVWVEQEIAIASFLANTLGKKFHVAAFAQEELKLEGVRKYIILNAKSFKTNADILGSLRVLLPMWQPISQPIEGFLVESLIDYEVVRREQERHQYRLIISLTNKGSKKISDFKVDVAVPKEVFVNPGTNACYTSSTPTHAQFSVTHKHQGNMELYRGETKQVLSIEYFVDENLFYRKSVLDEEVTATVVSGDMEPRTTRKILRELQQF